MSVTLHPLGIALAVIFVGSMALLFRWMFNVPPVVPHEVAMVCHSVAALQRILVPVSGKLASERAVELACRLGLAQKAEIILAYVMEVPFTLSLETKVPAEEAKGQEALGTARLIVEQHGLPVTTKIVPHRYAAAGILYLAKEQAVDAIVMSAGAGLPGPAEGLGRTSQEVLRRAGCEVIVDKAPVRYLPSRHIVKEEPCAS
jgi:nucleotide-binding universal stress UspA family protein